MAADRRLVGDLSEDHLIRTFFAPIATSLEDDVAAVDVPPGRQLLVSSDALIEGIHFLREAPALLTAQKALRLNVSDIVASGGKPRWFTLSLSLPRNLEIRWLEQFTAGLKTAMAETGPRLIGGDTTASLDKIAINITVLGTVEQGRRVTRSGARIGDWLGVTGDIGNAGVGLDVILGKHQLDPLEKWFWLERHFCPPFRGAFAEALTHQGLITAMMDLSDGLIADLPRLCKASSTGAVLHLDRLPLSDEARALGLTPREAARNGEDYELLFCARAADWEEIEALGARLNTPVTHVGSMVHGHDIVWQEKGHPVQLDVMGWRHFA